jgi:hypothetical protein
MKGNHLALQDASRQLIRVAITDYIRQFYFKLQLKINHLRKLLSNAVSKLSDG